MDRIERIGEMERRFNKASAAVANLENAIAEYEAVLPALKGLSDYQESGRWLRDFEADEKGRLPEDPRRGVLSEDGLYDLLRRADALSARLGIKTNEAENTPI